jgi:hypothetical protein
LELSRDLVPDDSILFSQSCYRFSSAVAAATVIQQHDGPAAIEGAELLGVHFRDAVNPGGSN